MTQKSARKHIIQVVAILKIDMYLITRKITG